MNFEKNKEAVEKFLRDLSEHNDSALDFLSAQGAHPDAIAEYLKDMSSGLDIFSTPVVLPHDLKAGEIAAVMIADGLPVLYFTTVLSPGVENKWSDVKPATPGEWLVRKGDEEPLFITVVEDDGEMCIQEVGVTLPLRNYIEGCKWLKLPE